MAMQIETSTELSGGSFLQAEGVFHFAIIWATEQPKKRFGDSKGELLDGFELEFDVLAGPNAGQSARQHFRNGNLNHKDGGKFAREFQQRMLEAIGVLDLSQRGKTVDVELTRLDADGEEEVLVGGRQFIGKMKKNKDGYIELSPYGIWHVDDPAAEKCERNQVALDQLPKELRRKPESFAKPKSNGNGNGNGSGKSTSTPPANTGADLEDL